MSLSDVTRGFLAASSDGILAVVEITVGAAMAEADTEAGEMGMAEEADMVAREGQASAVAAAWYTVSPSSL